MELLSRFCLDRRPDGTHCGEENCRIINDCHAANYIEFPDEGNSVEREGSFSVPNRPRASSLELLENRLSTVQEDPNNILNKRMKFSGRQFEFTGNPFSLTCMFNDGTV